MTEWLLAIDPGDEHVGWAIWHNQMPNVITGEKPRVESLGWLRDQLRQLNQLHNPSRGRLIIEEFRLYGGSTLGSQVWGQMTTSELIGAMKYIASEAGVPVTEQGATIKNSIRRQLVARGIKQQPGSIHAHDAELHLYHRGLKDTPEFREWLQQHKERVG